MPDPKSPPSDDGESPPDDAHPVDATVMPTEGGADEAETEAQPS